ncbi:Sec-independent protein translocase protein TatB [Frankia sp. AiPs1]|uniref:Sec-independent protein translocase protein TatB n=1 Tax=Frankia sp. AiPa1 TaxID=573492 RepID=UPI00202B9619|nr:Sec-independent protein translocase protein TatB [Frankia sp. AiPa1]MCL9758351.1 Sec-independent protein translocase protein TatB [Frankia sp. AiPa1]
MFNGVGWQEVAVLLLIGLFVFGPDRLPKAARDAGRMLRQLREMAAGMRNDLRSELGPEIADLDIRDLHPKTFVRKHLFDDEPLPPYLTKRSALDALLADDTPPPSLTKSPSLGRSSSLAKSALPKDLTPPAAFDSGPATGTGPGAAAGPGTGSPVPEVTSPLLSPSTPSTLPKAVTPRAIPTQQASGGQADPAAGPAVPFDADAT